MSDTTFEQLAERNDELLAANEALVSENDRLRAEIRAARNYAGEQLPAAAGTGIVHILESASREAT